MKRPCYDKAGNIVVIFKLHDWYIGSLIPHRVHLYRNLTSLNYTYGSVQVDWIITRLYSVDVEIFPGKAIIARVQCIEV